MQEVVPVLGATRAEEQQTGAPPIEGGGVAVEGLQNGRGEPRDPGAVLCFTFARSACLTLGRTGRLRPDRERKDPKQARISIDAVSIAMQ